METVWGATQEEWEAFESLCLSDLVPTICGPGVEHDPTSNNRREFDKVPSLVKPNGYGTHLKGWERRTTISTHDWKLDSRHGICMVTRRIFAIDIDIRDIEGSESCVQMIRSYLGEAGARLPARTRQGTGKLALLFRVHDGPERLKKTVVKTRLGNIEFLFHGQQLRVAGRHMEGMRLEWPDGIPTSIEQIPSLAIEDLIGLIRELNLAYRGVDEEVMIDASGTILATHRHKNQITHDDPMIVFLHQNDWVKGTRHDGAVDVFCPWAGDHDHPTPDNMTEATFFPIGLGGNHFHPGFKCMHATCIGRTHLAFLNKIGYDNDDWQMLPFDENAPALTRPVFSTNSKGKILARLENIASMFEWEAGFGYRVRYDRFCDQTFFRKSNSTVWEPLTDHMYARFRMRMNQIGMENDPPNELTRSGIEIAAHDNKIDSAQDWLMSLTWDGEPRIPTFHTRVLRLADTPYHKAVVEYLWTALAGRVLVPGCKADMMPIFIGPQGIRKSTFVEYLAPDSDQFTAVSLGMRDADLARQLRGKVVAEWDEMRGLNTRDAEGIKGWLSHRYDEWIPKFKELAVAVPRRFVVVGTANDKQVLNDPTGARRFLPVRVEQTIDTEYVKSNRDQLWAEAREMFAKGGVHWQQAEQLAHAMHKVSTVRDLWEDAVVHWLATQGPKEGWQSLQILTGACNVHSSLANAAAYHRLRRIMAKLGWSENDDGRWYCNLV
jgi:hypothetical protein